MVLSLTSSQNTASLTFTLSHLPLELILNIINCTHWDNNSILCLLNTSKMFYRYKEEIIKEHLKSYGVHYVQLQQQFAEALLPVETLYRYYQKSQLLSNLTRKQALYIPPPAWQTSRWPNTCLVSLNTLTVVLLLGNIACFQDLIQNSHFSSDRITRILAYIIPYETQLPFSIQSGLVEAIEWLIERHYLELSTFLLEVSIEYGCEKLTQLLLKRGDYQNVSVHLLAQVFVYRYCHPLSETHLVWQECLVRLGAKTKVEDSFNGKFLLYEDLLTHKCNNIRAHPLGYINSILSKFSKYKYPNSQEISHLTLGLISEARYSSVLQHYMPPVTEKEYVQGYIALLLYALSIGNVALVEHLVEVRHIPVTYKVLYKVVSIMAYAHEKQNKSTARYKELNYPYNKAVDDLFCKLLNRYYAQYVNQLTVEDKQAFIVNLMKANLIQSGHVIFSYEKNDTLYSEDFGLILFEAMEPFKQSNTCMLIQFLIHYFPSLCVELNLIQSALSAGDYNTMWYLIETYPEQLNISISHIVNLAFDYRQLPIIQSIVEKRSVIFKSIDWSRHFQILLEEEFFILTTPDHIQIDISRLEILHYLLDQASVAVPLTALQSLLNEIYTFQETLQSYPVERGISNTSAAYMAYATLLLTVLNKAISQYSLDKTEIEPAIEAVKTLVKGGMLFEVLDDWLLQGRYPNVPNSLLSVELDQFIHIILTPGVQLYSIQLIALDIKKLEALHALIAHYHIQDSALIPSLLDYVVRNHPERVDWVQLLIEQRLKVEHITWDEQMLIKDKYDIFGEQWLHSNYSSQLALLHPVLIPSGR